MIERTLCIEENKMMIPGVFKMTLSGDVSGITRPGQFINIKLDGVFLRRPLSVCDLVTGRVTVIYRVVGKGTEIMSSLQANASVSVLEGLGNGFDLKAAGERPILAGGGLGTPPMYFLAKELLKKGIKPCVCLGFNKRDDILLAEEFEDLGLETRISTVDGSFGTKGLITDILPSDYTYFYACGPLPMLRALYKVTKTEGQLSFEERMGCGFGACMGCTVETKNGYKRICKDGPVLTKEEIIWKD